MTEEEFEALSKAKKEEAVNKADQERFWFGFCSKCNFHIKAKLKEWPSVCPRCGHGGS